MLRPFKLTKHKIQKAQSFVNYIFLEIICRAPKLKENFPEFSSEMAGNYKTLLENTNHIHLLEPLKIIYRIARNLPPKDIKTLRRAVLINNQIRKLCIGMHQPVSYKDLSLIDPTLSINIQKFCYNLYKYISKEKEFYEKYLTLKDYYQTIIDCDTTCYCCGIAPISNKYNIRRSPFDHFLPQAIYPFVSLNTHNLVPTCKDCNDVKWHKDTLYRNVSGSHSKQRIKTFYPFRYDVPDIKIQIDIQKNSNLSNIQPKDIELQIDCKNHSQEVDNWKRMYDIESRYKAELCSTNIKKNYEQYLFLKKTGVPHNKIIEAYEINKYGDKNIIKIPLMECMNQKDLNSREKGFID